MTTRRLLISILAGVMLLAGCSDSDDGGNDSSATADETTTTTEVAADPSAGCAAGKTSQAGQTDEALSSGGEERTYRQFVPPDADGSTPLSLVINIHGLGSNGDQQEALTAMEVLADTEGFVVLTPNGLGTTPFWNYIASDLGAGDIAFISELIDATGESLCIDLARVYSTGMSNGGLMSSTLACRLPDQIAAAAPVSGLAFFDDCGDSRPVSIQVVYGTDDSVLPITGGLGEVLQSNLGSTRLSEDATQEEQNQAIDNINFPPVDESMADWAALEGCDPEPTEEEVSEEVTRLEWPDCDGGSQVVLYRVDGGGHTWPGSPVLTGDDAPGATAPEAELLGHTTDDISATELAWEFFQAHPRRS